MKNNYLNSKSIFFLLALAGEAWICNSYSQNGWEQMHDMPTARGNPGSCLLDDNIYVIGGWGIPGGNPLAFACTEVYDTLLDEWTVLANAKETLVGHTINVVNNKIYSIGNYEESTVEEYDPLLDTWTVKNNMPEIRWNHASCVYNDTIFIFGGVSAPDKSVRIYEPETEYWNSLPDMNHARSYASACVYNDKIYVFGGIDWSIGAIRKVEVYDPAENTWGTVADIPAASYGHITIEHENKILLFGGDNGLEEINPLKHVFEYNPETDEWTRMKDMPFTRSLMAGNKVGKYVYLFGGFPEPTRENMSSEVWRFNLDSLKVISDTTSVNDYIMPANNTFILYQNYPNPFTSSTQIQYKLIQSADVQLNVYNFLAQKIVSLVDEVQAPGTYEAEWNTDGMHPGVYLCELKAGGLKQTCKMIVTR